MKAYRWANGKVALFRPKENARRFARSAERMAMPPVDADFFVEAVKALVRTDAALVPREPGSLYIRPTMMGTEAVHRRACLARVSVLHPRAALGRLLQGHRREHSRVSYGLCGGDHVARRPRGHRRCESLGQLCHQPAHHRRRARSKGCSQVLFLDSSGKRQVEELGGMNVFFVENDTLVTPPLHDTILPGITRDSVIQVARDLGIRRYANRRFRSMKRRRKFRPGRSGSVRLRDCCGGDRHRRIPLRERAQADDRQRRGGRNHDKAESGVAGDSVRPFAGPPRVDGVGLAWQAAEKALFVAAC